jgi:hypothetical protein
MAQPEHRPKHAIVDILDLLDELTISQLSYVADYTRQMLEMEATGVEKKWTWLHEK